MSKKYPSLSLALIERYLTHLREAERSSHTISKYAHDLMTFLKYLNGKPLTKAALIEWKSTLVASFMPTTVNSMLVAVNCYLSFMGWQNLKVNLLKIQNRTQQQKTQLPYLGHNNYHLDTLHDSK